MKLAIIKDSERELLNKISDANRNENSLWKIPNLLIPIGTILLAFLCLIAFSDKRSDMFVYFNLVLNGSLPLIAINQISGIGLHVFKFNKDKERSMQMTDTLMLRTKLFYFAFTILIVSVLIFAVQVINAPFMKFPIIILLFIISLVLLITSSSVSKKIFLLQEDFIDKTFDSEIRERSREHGQDWGNN